MAGRGGCRILAVLALVCHTALAFKAHEFKTCDQNPFCKRNRERAPGAATYVVNGGFSAQGTAALSNPADGTKFTAEFNWYSPGVVRFRMKEVDKVRYEVPDVLSTELPSLETKWDSVNAEGPFTRLIKGDINVFVHHMPFSFRVFRSGVEVLSFNDQKLLHYENIRDRKPEDAADMWEAKFKGFTDKIRNGPTSIMFDVAFPGSAEVYGIPEHATSLALKSTKGEGIVSEPYRLFNLDVFEYLHDSPFGLYGSIPMLMAHGTKGSTGIYWHNAAEMYVDVSREKTKNDPQTSWFSESGMLDLFIMTGPKPLEVVTQYSALTGNTYLPPLFSIGYHQCRWNYNDEADVDAVDQGFDDSVMPYDVIWLDIEHTDGKRYFTWDKHLFPTPERMQEDIASKGRKMVNIVDPHIKRDANYYVHAEATKMGLYVKDASGKDYEGWCWPGSSSYLDFTNPQVRQFWTSKFGLSQYKGSTSNLYIWNDMNEPSVFNGPEITMPKDALHHGNWEHRDVHNLYGYYLHMATSEGLARREPGNLRPFVLSRAFFAGTQRIGPIWTGDNTADWHHLQVSLPMLLTLGVSGLTFSGADVGGFFGNPDPELLVRWYQVGAFYPFFRGHAHQETKRREPWLFGEPATTHIRNALRMRYSLLPYMYTLFAEASLTNAPVMRPLFFEFPEEAALYAREDCFMLGPALLVAPVLHAGHTEVDAALPGTGPWYRLSTGERLAAAPSVAVPAPLEDVPVFVRGGHVVARRERPRRSAAAMAGDPYTLVVALDAFGRASGELYEDDGLTTAHADGAFVHRTFTFADGVLRSTARRAPSGQAIYTTATVVERIVVLGLPGAPRGVVVESSVPQRPLEAAMGPVSAGSPAGPKAAVVVRKPDLPVAADWAVRFDM
mmetsp:Transcript_7389/g.15074  ORF Transcript_7389/g.15074 Transcript_7389/m.15074 type:complete len:893 (-) Transcript_7389:33-2711(-)|eukprot:CAMPEP_0118943722 /NCGR_PEP_ID=MMETSP1169-20130426/38899_1 /TAXON_ID=36882 /ORGANISM="Pyramimonas obovata, Strain CCMP722" /LENGTH=892 /DNA_ID=CAMNT_0006889039 /DNA_START=74 /DNA_END=2752 /DNA_ORIENTATION=-